MKLASRIQGRGPDLVLLHGWGLHSGIWTPLVKYLERSFTCHLIDLPGHGDSAFGEHLNMASWADAVFQVAPERASWLGWSLGGLVAQELALRHPALFDALVLIASTPRFVQATDWPHAIESGTLKSFEKEFERNPAAVMQRFLGMQVKGSRRSTVTLRELRDQCTRKPFASSDGLRVGLDILQSADFRQHLPDFPVPLFFLLGERDILVPFAVAESLRSHPVQVIAGAGHAPFLSDTPACASIIGQWLSNDSRAQCV